MNAAPGARWRVRPGPDLGRELAAHQKGARRCGRPGVEQQTEEGRVCVHAETTEIQSDGMLTLPVESCPLGPLPFAVKHPEVI